MFSTKSLLATISAAMLIGTANAFNGTANLGFYGTTNCGCPPWNGPYAVAVPSDLVGSAVCCNDAVTLSYLGKSIPAVFSGIYDAGAGSQNVALSPTAFAALAGFPEETSLSPVTWSFN
ncbi:hypothetical protein B0H10DRAFT_1400212 [Mycena sp. CBHHK59/15]|nr:hypothetical protein B0H10DRAFT_1400212 [Mycena sp. CBHHK59/15]